MSIPVVGNGDVQDHSDGINKAKNLDGFMIGRSAIGNPWVFCNPNERASPSFTERVETAIRHYELLREFQTEQRALREFRKYLREYIQGFQHAKEQRKKLMTCEREEDFLQQMREIANWKVSDDELAFAS